jgi:hypothetical protein
LEDPVTFWRNLAGVDTRFALSVTHKGVFTQNYRRSKAGNPLPAVGWEILSTFEFMAVNNELMPELVLEEFLLQYFLCAQRSLLFNHHKNVSYGEDAKNHIKPMV